MSKNETLLEVKNLRKYFPIRAGFFRRKVGEIKAVNDVSFTIKKGEIFGLVGESGSGKSTTGRTILRLLEPTSGEIIFDGHRMTNLRGKELRKWRKDFQMVYQDPYASLNPKMTVGQIVGEPIKNFMAQRHSKIEGEVKSLLKRVGLTENDYYKYPHEFSGGQRQRIGIARALALKPKLIIADEPVSALDVSIQAQVINLFKQLQEEFGLTYLFIAHDLAVVKYLSDRIGVMKDGYLVELAPSKELYENPIHPYTKSLLSAILTPDPITERNRKRITYQASLAETEEVATFREVFPDHWVRCTPTEFKGFKRNPSL